MSKNTDKIESNTFKLFRWLPELQELTSQLGEKLANKVPSTIKPKNPTKIKEFKLTKPKPKSVPIPEELPKVPRPKSVSK